MMFQPIDREATGLDLNDRPNHPMVIQNDEVVDLTIDLETLDGQEIYEKYFAI